MLRVTLDVALATCLVLPEPDADLPLLLIALRAAGLSAEALAWDDPRADFAGARITLLRSTWNYSEQPAAFLAWVDGVAECSSLWNGPDTVRWNAHKSYLLDLQTRGVQAVPTHLVQHGQPTTLAEIMRERGWSQAVVKPAVSGGSRATVRVTESTLDRGEAHLRTLAAREDVLVQPYLRSVEGHGERAIVWIDGQPTHAVRKSPRFLGDPESVSAAVPIEADEADLARRAVAAAPGPLLYARIDVARDEHGAPCVMELELIEPSLFFAQAPVALERYVAAVGRLLRGRAARSG
jgi:glutathione synthase/RimK-type ligase-like ATP-grasp enzyme